jgi:hypothetical protein
MLKLRSIGLSDYAVLEGGQRREKPRRLSDEMIKAVKPYDAGQN